jgi:transposase
VPRTTIIEMAPEEQAHILAEVRRARHGYVLALQIILLCAAQRTPTEIAAVLFCSRTTVYRVAKAYRAGQWTGGAEAEESRQAGPSPRLRVRAPEGTRAVLALVPSGPRLGGWGRTRWRCATLALELQARRGVVGSGETVRRWLQDLGGAWTRAQLRAQEDDPQRREQLARIRDAGEHGRAGVARFFADDLDLSLLAKVGSQGRPQGEQVEVLTPGTKEKRPVAGALPIPPGAMAPCKG